MTIKGTLHEIGEINQVTDSFKKRDFVVLDNTNPQYPEYISFQLSQNNVHLLDNFKEGQFVEVDFNLKGRPWTNKEGVQMYFNSLSAWRITPLMDHIETVQIEPLNLDDGTDDLPF